MAETASLPERAVVSLHRVRFDYTGKKTSHTALDGISFDIRPGEFMCILGPSGCGKSTLLRLIAGLNRPSGGKLTVRGNRSRVPAWIVPLSFRDIRCFPG